MYLYTAGILVWKTGTGFVVVEGYEPNPCVSTGLFEIAMEVGGSRSHSVPVGDRNGPGGLEVNPFYSEKAKDQCRLDAARPKELPAQEEEVLAGSFSSPELAIQSNVDGNPTGKGRSVSGCVMPDE